MVLIRRGDIPQHLQESCFFQLLDPNDEEEFDVPDDCFMRNLDFSCLSDLRHYLQTFQFWGGKHLDDHAYIYMFRNCGLFVMKSLQKEFYQIDVFNCGGPHQGI